MSILATGALILGGLQAATGITQSIIGYRQRKKALSGLDQLQDPQMDMPSGVEEMINLARIRAGREMPGMERAKDEFGARTSRGLDAVTRASRTSGDVAAATADLYAEEMRNVRQIETQGAEYRAAREGELMRGLETKGRYEDRMFQVNEMMPFQRKLNQYMENARVGGENIASGIGTAFSGASGALSNYARIKMMESWMDQGGATPESGELDWMGAITRRAQESTRNREINL